MSITDDSTVKEVKEMLHIEWKKGVECPCCTQYVKLYKRNFSWASAVVMIEIYKRVDEGEYLYLPDILTNVLSRTAQQGGYATLAHFWGLIEQQFALRDDGSNRVGWWKLTDKGRAFVKGELTVPKYALTFNGRSYGLVGDNINIKQALQEKFDYKELMGDALALTQGSLL